MLSPDDTKSTTRVNKNEYLQKSAMVSHAIHPFFEVGGTS